MESTVARSLAALDRLPIVVCAHQRSGTHLTIDLLRRQFEECRSWKWWGENNSRLYLSLDALFDPAVRWVSERKAIALLRRCERPLIKTHLLEPPASTEAELWRQWLAERATTVYVYRDGRDVLCSQRLLEAKRDRRNLVPLSEFIRQRVGGLSRPAAWAQHVERGLDLPGVVALRFEKMKSHPREMVEALAGRLGLTARYREPLLPRKPGSIWGSRSSRLFERRPESTAILGRPAGLRLEKWQEVLTRRDREFFQREAGDILIRLGYVPSDAWVG